MSQPARSPYVVPKVSAANNAIERVRGDLYQDSGRVPHVVIVGAGFGGLTTAQLLARADVQITLIDRRNHHLFQPLLYQVATAGLSPAQIASPIRSVLRNQRNATVLLDEVTGVDEERREIVLNEKRIPFDYLVLATGARHSYFGHDEWEKFAPGLKSIEDATHIRRQILLAFEEAESEPDEEKRKALLTFIIIGGGPTGVEVAGKIVEIARHALIRDFRNINPAAARILLVEAGPRLLPTFAPGLSRDVETRIAGLGVEVSLGKPVTACDANGVIVGSAPVPARTIIWAAGVAASPAARWLGVPADKAGRAIVRGNLTIPGADNIFVIGDTAAAKNPDGKLVPGLAAAAKQEAAYVANAIRTRIAGGWQAEPFIYTDVGSLATIGRNAAVVDFGRIKLTGFIGWLAWSFAHLYFLIGFRNRVVAFVDWAWNYLTYQRGARLITDEHPQ